MFKGSKKYYFILILLPVFLYISLSVFSSVATFRVSNEESSLNPLSVGLEFQELKIISNNKTVSSWWIPNDTDRTLLVLHGLRGQKGDELILNLVKEFHKLGFSIIAIDFRNHGASSKGDFTFGLDEINDVYTTLDYYYESKGIKHVGIWGFSYGATTAIFSGQQYGQQDVKTEIVGIFSDTPYFSLTDMISTQISRRTPLNLFMANLLKPGILIFTNLFYGFDFNAIEQNYIENSGINIPTIIIGCTGDKTVPLEQSQKVHKSLGENSTLIEFENCRVHGEAFDSDPSRYLQEFEKHFIDLF